jgi:hypothetical protein
MSLGKFFTRKALPWFFRCIFSSLTCLKKTLFRKGALLRWKVLARLYGILWPVESTSQPVIISWKNPSSTLRRKTSVIFDLLPRPTGLGHRFQITEGHALRPFCYTWFRLEAEQTELEPADDYMSHVKHLLFFFLWIFWTLTRLKMAQITAQLIRITSGWQKVLSRLAK